MRASLKSIICAAALAALLVGCPPGGDQNMDPNQPSDNGSAGNNDNGSNNDNGGSDNGNNNGNADTSDGKCDDGTISLAADLAGSDGQTGDAAYRELVGGCREFVLELHGFAAGVYSVTIGGAHAADATVQDGVDFELEYSSDQGNFPSDFPMPSVGDVVAVAGAASGTLIEDCPAAPVACELEDVEGDEPNEPSEPPACGEDAAMAVEVIVEHESTSMTPSSCPVIKPQLETRMATVRFRNTDPMRTIAISAILIERSDKQSLSPSPCERARDGSVTITDEDCLTTLATGCNSPVSLFIGPGEESPMWHYQCMREDIYPGSGACGDQELETRRWSVLAQAVFCDDYETAIADFCDNVDRHLILAGQPSNRWDPITSDECP